MPLTEVRALQDWTLKPALRRTPGVADIVKLWRPGEGIPGQGQSVPAAQVRDHRRPAGQALANNSANTGGGLLKRGDEALVIRGIGLFSNIEDIRRVVVASRGGRPIQVGDLARVEIGGRPRSGIVAFNEREDVVQAIVQMTKGQNATKVVEDLKIEIANAAAKLPPGVSIVPYYDRTDLVKAHRAHRHERTWRLGAALVGGDIDAVSAQLVRGAGGGDRDPAVAAVCVRADGSAWRGRQSDLAGGGRLRHHHRQRGGAG